MRTRNLALAILLACVATPAIAQDAQTAPAAPPSQSESLGDAARRARAEKKDQPRPAKVFTNENLPTDGTVNVVGAKSAPDSNASAGSAAASAPAPESNAQPAQNSAAADQKKAAESAELAEAKEKLASIKKDLDIDQRKYSLDQQSYLSNPNHQSDSDGSAALKTEEDDISSKQEAVEVQQKIVDDLQSRVGAPPASDTSSGNSTSGTSNTGANDIGSTAGASTGNSNSSSSN